MKYRVTDPKGITVNGEHHAAGSVVRIPPGAAEKAFVHFKQVEPAAAGEAQAKGEAEDAAPPPAELPSKPKK